MPQYAVLIYEHMTPGWPADIPEAIQRENELVDDRIREAGGTIVAGMALDVPATATAIRGGVLTDGPFVETKEALAGLFVLEAENLDHALALAALTPTADGGVEVRPLIGLQIGP